MVFPTHFEEASYAPEPLQKNLSLLENIFAGARMPILRHPLVILTLILKIHG